VEERGQGTVEWVGLLLVVALLLTALVAAGVRVRGASMAQAVASRLLCAAALADRWGDEPALIAAYGSEVGRLARDHMPSIAFERGSRAMPVDFRRCRSGACGDGTARGLVDHTDAGLPVTAFVHVIDCRDAEPGEPALEIVGAGAEASRSAREWDDVPDCSGGRTGHLYIQYWTYYADSATLRDVPVAGDAGYHRDDWESIQIRIGPDGHVDQRASSHHGYNHVRSVANLGSDAGIAPVGDAAEAIGARPGNGWGPASGLLLVSGGSHAGNSGGFQHIDRIVPGGRVHLVPLESITSGLGATAEHRFAVSPPWRKRVWLDPEADGTD
jgi:hypothetical protein